MDGEKFLHYESPMYQVDGEDYHLFGECADKVIAQLFDGDGKPIEIAEEGFESIIKNSYRRS